MVAKRRNKQREWREIDQDILLIWYRSLLFNQKNEFFLCGYIFPDPGKTAIKMPGRSDRCLRAGALFESLLEYFVIFYGKLEVTDQPTSDERQACYQVGGFVIRNSCRLILISSLIMGLTNSSKT